MTLPDPLQRLHDLDRSSPQFSSQLAELLDQKEYIKCLPDLHSENLVWLVEYLDRVSFPVTVAQSPLNATTGSYRHLRSHKSRLPEVTTRTRENMQHPSDITKIVHAFTVSPEYRPVVRFRLRV